MHPAPQQAGRPCRLGLDAELPHNAEGISGGYSLATLAVFVVIVAGMAAYSFALRLVPLTIVSTYGIAALAVAGLVWLTVRSIRARRLIAQHLGDVPKKVDFGSGDPSHPSDRLLVVGRKADLARFAAHAPITDEAFEPIVFFAPRIMEQPRAAKAALVLTAVAVVGLMMALRAYTTLPVMKVGWLNVMFGIAAGVCVQMLLWPTYLRLAPGRLDVMRFTIGRRTPEITTVNLRNAQVLVNFKLKAIYVRPHQRAPEPDAAEQPPPAAPAPPPNHHRWLILNLGGVWRPTVVAHAVLNAALSSAPTPPLPDDQLTG